MCKPNTVGHRSRSALQQGEITHYSHPYLGSVCLWQLPTDCSWGARRPILSAEGKVQHSAFPYGGFQRFHQHWPRHQSSIKGGPVFKQPNAITKEGLPDQASAGNFGKASISVRGTGVCPDAIPAGDSCGRILTRSKNKKPKTSKAYGEEDDYREIDRRETKKRDVSPQRSSQFSSQ